ncbi:proline-rich protein 5 isoform X4 [Canis lupus dingo]|uniref:proline-rich protein 5 isoform X4 n=1 Tax=Canis lupus dingo TaxID=286419 RepID=UPI0015F19A73|nr:proline-rich protein 5 isoform X4 [Canis lupus dingo]XP_038534663.1 proline-rich protein 5 isoform X4 [Canis lupus familiaris]
MSSPSLSDLGKREPAAAGADERGTQQRRACANATWNSIHNGVIAVFQRKGLPDQELFSLNEGVRQLLKTELGSFFTEYLQNQLLTKGMVILRDKIRFYEGQKLLDSLAETWDFFFSDVLPTLQAIFYPVQGGGRGTLSAGQGAVGAPAGPAALPEHHHPEREAGGRAGPHPRPRAPRHRPDAAGAAGGARVPGRDQGLLAAGDADPEGGVTLPGHLRPLFQRGPLHTFLHPGEALPAPLPLRGRSGQEPRGALQELQHPAAEPRGGARGRGCSSRWAWHPQALGLGDDVLPRAPGFLRLAWPGPRRGLQTVSGAPVGAVPQQTVPTQPAP